MKSKEDAEPNKPVSTGEWKTGGYVILSMGLISPPDEPGLELMHRDSFPPNFDPLKSARTQGLIPIDEWERGGCKCLNGQTYGGSVPRALAPKFTTTKPKFPSR